MRLRFLDTSEDGSAPHELEIPDLESPVQSFERLREPQTTLEMVEAALFRHDAPLSLVNRVMARRVGQSDPTKFLTGGLKLALKFRPIVKSNTNRLLLMGPPGAGKSTTVAKLASREGLRAPTVLTTDLDRPGGIEQLAEFLAVLGIEPLSMPLTDQSSAASAADAGYTDDQAPLLIDTAGTDPGDTASLTRLGNLATALNAEPLLVIPAILDSIEARDFAQAALSIGVRRVIFTRLDIARRLGAVLAAADAGLTLAGGSITPHFAFGFKPLSASIMARHLLTLIPA